MEKSIHEIYVERVKKLLSDCGLTASKASLLIGGNKGLLSDSFNKGSFLGGNNIVRLAELLKTSPQYLLVETDDREKIKQGLDIDLNSAKIKGYVQAGLWGSADEEYLPEEEQQPVPIFGNFPYKSVYGLIVKGDSMDKVYQEGDLLLCVNIWEYGRENIKPGANLIIKAISTSDEIETTVKKLEVDNNGHLWLVPQCTTEGKYKKYPVPNIEDIDDLSIKINGKTIKRISVDAYVYSSTRLSSR